MKNPTLEILLSFFLAIPSFAAGPFDNNIKNAASNDCVGKVQQITSAINTYWTLPSLSSLERKDTFIPTMVSRNPFQGIGSGQHNISYEVTSQYATSDLKTRFNVYGGKELVFNLLSFKLSPQVTLMVSSSVSSCDSGTKWNPGTSDIQRYFYFTSTNVSGMFFISDINTLCANPNLTMMQALAGSRPNVNVMTKVAGLPGYCTNTSDTNCSAMLSEIQSVTRSVSVATFCSVFQNGN